MTKLFTKTLIAASLLSVMGAANAANFVSPTVKGVSKQALSQLTVDAQDLVLHNAVQYGVGTELVFTFSAGELSVAPLELTTTAVGTPVALAGGTKFVRVAATPTTATYRLEAGSIPAPVLVGGVPTDYYTITAGSGTGVFQFTGSSVRAVSSINASILPKSVTGVAIDAASGTGESLTRNIIRVGNEFTTSVATTVPVKTLNLASGRKAFTGSGDARFQFALDASTADRTTIAYLDATGAAQTAPISTQATGTNIQYTMAGDFSWINDIDASAPGIQAKAGTISFIDTTASCAINSLTVASLVYTCNLPANNDTATNQGLRFDIRQGETTVANALVDGSYAVSGKVTYTGGSLDTISNAKTLTVNNNGDTKYVYYVPYGAGISQILYVTNKTAEVGKIYATATDEAGTKLLDNVDLGIMTTANGITSIAGEIRGLLPVGYTGKLNLRVDIESSSTELFSAYNVNGDRLATK